jgi:Tfp pilus assembly protein PilX
MIFHPCLSSPQGQRGAATLLVSMVLLMATTLLVLYTSRIAVSEQRMSANEVRARQAYSAAQGGLDLAIANMNGGGSFTDTLSTSALGAGVNASYRARYCARTLAVAALPTCAGTPADLACTAPVADDVEAWTVSCGWSDDNAARKRVVSYLGKMDAFPNIPTNPLVAKGGVNVGGSATVTNYYNNLTIWSGGSLGSIGSSGKTFIRNPTVAAPSSSTAPPEPPSNCTAATADYVCTTSASVYGPDVIQGDTSLSNLGDTQFFANFLGQTPDNYRSSVDLQLAAANVNTLDGMTDKTIWVEGDASFSGNMTIGTRDNPVVLVINGDLTGSGIVTVYGVLFVVGDWSVGGNVTNYGSTVVRGAISGSGSLDVIYDPVALGNTGNLDQYASLPGTWRDW